ncbi:hypothetical protein SLS57_010916 [Botryosphaeria dothidea]
MDYALFLFNTAKFYLGSILYIVDEAEFLRNIHEFYNDPVAKAVSSRHWYSQFLLILAFGKASIANERSRDGPPGYQYAARAMALMPDLAGLAPDPVQAVQALALGAVYLQSVDMRVGASHHIGHALRTCIIEGWHRYMPEEVVGVELSRRCNIIFWVVYRLDREFGPLIGAPCSIYDGDITAKLPSDIDESLDALNMTLHVRLSRLMAQILTEAFLPFQLEDASSSAFILYLIRTINPSLLTDESWPEDVQRIMDKMISKGSVAAPLRKRELGQLEDALVALSPVGDGATTPASSAHSQPPHQEQQPAMPSVRAADSGWELFLENGIVGISPTEMLDLAAQLEVDNNFVPQVVGW